jgi:hypothetical protein
MLNAARQHRERISAGAGRNDGIGWHFATGAYRWVRNPIYLGALLVVLGKAWLFLSVPLLIYTGCMAINFHLFCDRL